MALIASVHRQTRLKINNEARHTHRMDIPAHSGECINTASKHGAHQMHTGTHTQYVVSNSDKRSSFIKALRKSLG